MSHVPTEGMPAGFRTHKAIKNASDAELLTLSGLCHDEHEPMDHACLACAAHGERSRRVAHSERSRPERCGLDQKPVRIAVSSRVARGLPQRVQIKADFDRAGRRGEVVGEPIDVRGMLWTPVLWDDEEDPDWFKSAGLEPGTPVIEHHVVIVVRSPLPFVKVMSELLGLACTKFTAGPASGFDLKKREAELALVTQERNDAVAECHRLRCEATAESKKRKRKS